jgi:hypothetical protein
MEVRMRSTQCTTLATLIFCLSAPIAAAQTTAAPERVQLLRVVARDYVYDAPQTVPSGITTIQLINQGTDIHHVSVQELPPGKTVKDFFDATRNSGRAPTWSKSLGTSATIPNGGEAFISFRMPPGQYILSCLIPARDGRSHVAKGMYQIITATGPAAPAAVRR